MNAQTGQAPIYPPQINHNPQQFYNYQPANATTKANCSPYKVQQVGNVGGAFQCHQGSAAVMPQNGYAVPSQSAFQNNNAALEIPGQIPAPASQVVHGGAWTTGLFDCMDDPTNALTTALFPCVTFGQIADVLDNGHTTCTTSGIIYAAAPCFVPLPYRRKLRQLFGLVEAPSSDLLVQSVFQPFALCQEYRELKNRGIDPALGYHGNLDRLNNLRGLTTVVPPKNQMMN